MRVEFSRRCLGLWEMTANHFHTVTCYIVTCGLNQQFTTRNQVLFSFPTSPSCFYLRLDKSIVSEMFHLLNYYTDARSTCSVAF